MSEQLYTIERTGKPPIQFDARFLGEGTNRGPNTVRWFVLNIYRTKGGKVVVHERHYSQWEGETYSSDSNTYETAQAAIDALRGEDGRFCAVAQEAIVAACLSDLDFRVGFIERIE